MTVDLGYLRENTGDDPAILMELIQIFIEQVGEITRGMEHCIAGGEWTELGKLAHKAKHSVAVIGLQDLAEELKKLENWAKESKNTDQYPRMIEHFKKVTRIAIQELEYIIANNSSKK